MALSLVHPMALHSAVQTSGVRLSHSRLVVNTPFRASTCFRKVNVVRAAGSGEESKVVREFNEADGTISSGSSPSDSASNSQKAPGGNAYIDELPPIPEKKMSKEMQDRLKKEYLGFGGSTNTAMGQNWFLWIILIISGLAVLSAVTGAI